MTGSGRHIILIAHNIRSIHNIGALLRTTEGLGVKMVISGYSPYPRITEDRRLPHEITNTQRAIHKTALGAEEATHWRHIDQLSPYLSQLRVTGFHVYALEQTADSLSLPAFSIPDKLAIIVGNEITGIEKALLKTLDGALEIPMLGEKESFNVSAAAAMALYHSVFNDFKN